MAEPESVNTMLQRAFVSTGTDQYSLRTAASSSPGGSPLAVDDYPLKLNSVLDSRAVFEPAAGAILAMLPSSELPPGYYHLRGTWGNLKIAGGGEPTFTDIGNFGFFGNNFLVDDLVALNGVAASIDGHFNLGGFDISIRTKVAGSPNVCYMGLLIATKIQSPGTIIPPPM